MNIVLNYVFYFFLYSFMGWFVESLYCSIGEKKWINRGFLKGPICPIYGTGAVVITVGMHSLVNYFDKWYFNTLLIFCVGMVLCDIVEFITSFLMEKLFNARWWDYSKKRFNIQGRICLTHTFYWGFASVVFLQIMHPFISENIDKVITPSIRNNLLIAILTIFALDLFNTVRSALRFRSFSVKLQSLSEKMGQVIFETVGTKVDELQSRGAQARKELAADVREQLSGLKTQFLNLLEPDKSKVRKSVLNLMRSFPYLRKGVDEEMERLEHYLDKIETPEEENDEE